MFRALGYFIAQGGRNLGNHKLMSAVSIGIVAASLLLLGVFQLVWMNLNTLIAELEQQCEINVYLTREMDQIGMERVKGELLRIPGVAEVRFFSKEERLERTKKSMYAGREYMLEDLEEDNYLRDSYILSVNSLTQSGEVAEAAKGISGVDEVVNRQDLADRMQSVSRVVRRIGLSLMLLLALIAMFIVANTIRIGLLSRSGEMEIMRFVGASNAYIRGPFMIEGILLGLLGALLAGGLTLAGYLLLIRSSAVVLPGFSGQLLLPLDAVVKPLAASFLVIGAGIGLIGSGFSVRKHLKV